MLQEAPCLESLLAPSLTGYRGGVSNIDVLASELNDLHDRASKTWPGH